MSWTTLALRPLDGLFFRDDRPFNQDDEGLAEARSLFPPFPTQLAGGLRAALARVAGWERGEWSDELKGRLGDGASDAGQLRFGPPLLLRRNALGDGWEPLYRLPAAVFCRPPRAGEPRDRLVQEARLARPGDPGTARSDLPLTGVTGLLALPGDARFQQRPDVWVTATGMRHLLGANELSQPWVHLLTLDDLARSEQRVGLERVYGTHRAMTGMLYTAAHRRLRDTCALGVAYDWADGRGEPSPEPQPVFPLGGHGRAVAAESAPDVQLPWTLTPSATEFHWDGAWLHVLIVLISPTQIDGHAAIKALGGELVSACVERPLIFGGWDVKERAPVKRYHPAGSTFFLRLPCRGEDQRAAIVETLGRQQQDGLGPDPLRRLGCGAFLVGTWHPETRGGGDGR